MDETWRTSSYSKGGHQDCVECRSDGTTVQVRDTRHRHLGHLEFSAGEWAALLSNVRSERL